jgi:uncharacterized protein (TIGR03437 family)
MAKLDRPTDVALGPDGSLYIAEAGGGRIRRIWPNGRIATLDIGPRSADYREYAAFLLGLIGRADFTFEVAHNRIAVSADGEIAWTAADLGWGIPGLILGLPPSGVDAGLATVAYRVSPAGVATQVRGPSLGHRAMIDWLPGGGMLLGSEDLDQLLALSAHGTYEVLAGVGAEGASGDGGSATEARLRTPQSIAALSTGEIYIADEDRVRVVRPNGVIEAAAATLPEAYLASDAADNLYIAGEETLLRRTPGGAVETLALAADCTDCQDRVILVRPPPYAFGRIAADTSGLWIQGRTSSGRIVRVTDRGELLVGAFPPLPFPLSILRPLQQSVGVDAQGGLVLATGGLIHAFDPKVSAWREIPGSAGFTRGDVRHSLRTAEGDVYYTLEDRVLRLTPEGTLNTVAGLEAGSPLQVPSALALTADGDLLIADSEAGLVFRMRAPSECDQTVRPQIYVSGVSNATGPGGYPTIVFNGEGGITFASRVSLGAAFAPGMITSAFGVRLGPREPAGYDRDASSVPTQLAGVSATAGGKPVGVAFAAQGQLNLVLPFDLPESGEVDLVVTVDGVASEPYRLSMGQASPGVFAVLNTDGSLNSKERPAKAGDEVALLVSGLGRPDVDVDALRISDDVIPWPTADLAIGLSPADQNADMLTVHPVWARSRPGQIVSLVEVRFRIPEGAYISPNGNDAVLARGEVWTQFDLYLE